MDLRLDLVALKEQFARRILAIPDFPEKGVLFRDITPVLAHAEAFQAMSLAMASQVFPGTTKLVAIESRGFILASAMAQHLNVGVVLARKPGKLPRKVLSQSYDLEYGKDRLEIHCDDLSESDSVTLIDDVLATGGTAQAAEKLIMQTKAQLLGSVFLIELEALQGKKKLSTPYHSLLSF